MSAFQVELHRPSELQYSYTTLVYFASQIIYIYASHQP